MYEESSYDQSIIKNHRMKKCVMSTRRTAMSTHRTVMSTQDNFSIYLRELKMAKTYVLIVSLSFICYLPYGVSVIYYDIGGSVAEDTVKWKKGMPLWVTVALHEFNLELLVFFFWTNRGLRKEGSKIVKKYFSTRDGR